MTNDIKRMITILTPCFNEVDNVEELVDAIINIRKKFPDIKMKHLFIDNASTDGTVKKLRKISDQYDHIQVILNNRNYGHIRAPMHGLFQSEGDAVVVMASDFQDPPELIIEFVNKWIQGHKVVIGIKKGSDDKEDKHGYYDKNYITSNHESKNQKTSRYS